MTWISSCPHGHQWVATEGGVGAAASAEVCPECGQAGVMTCSTSLLGEVADELPPRPKPLPESSPDTAPALLRDRLRNGAARGQYPPVEGYEILREVGRGGMGVVYQARQLSLNRLVALKMVLAGAHAGVEELLRFRSEAEAAAQLVHPNIVQIHEVGQADGQPYFSMEYVEGGNLAQQLATPLPAQGAAQLVETLARAVHHAHAHGVIHRDLKPANVMLTADGVPKVTDFGLAKAVEREPPSAERGEQSAQKSDTFHGTVRTPHSALRVLTHTGAVLGTPSYMAPEQALGRSRDISAATDVYALGAILYEALTGRPPFHAATPLETLQQVVSEEPVPLSRLQRKLSGDLETICLKCLQKEPAKRYASAAALADDLRRFLNRVPIRARRTGTPERLWRWCRRNPKVASLGAALVVVFLGGFVGVTVQWHRVEEQRSEADKNYRLARRVVNDYFASLGTEPLLDHPGALPLRQELLETALRHFQDLREQRDDVELQVHLARACFCLGQIRMHDDRYAEAGAQYRAAVTIQQQLVSEQPNVVRHQRDLARSLTGLGFAHAYLREFDAAAKSQAEALAIRERLHQDNPADLDGQRDLALGYSAVGWLHHAQRESALGLPWLRRARDLLERVVHAKPEEVAYQAALGGACTNLGLALLSLGEPAQALAVHEAAIRWQEPAFAHNPRATQYRHMISVQYFNKGSPLLHLNRPIEAAEAARRARELNREDPFNLWRAARILAAASEKVGGGGTTADQNLSRQLADEALKTLKDSVDYGFTGTFDSHELNTLRARADFQELVARLKRQTQAAKR